MANPITFIFGYRTITADIAFAADIFNLSRKHGMIYRNQTATEETVRFECSLFTARRLEKLCLEAGICFLSVKERGVPRLFYKYRHRYGIFLGLIISVLLVFLSSTVVWDIRIDGERRLTEEKILADLSMCGINIGSPIRSLDTDVIQNRMIIYSDDISWISINLSGTVAHVEIRESEPIPHEKVKYTAANLVADTDGEIRGFENVRGEIVVKIGDLVRCGDLLVSGIRNSTTQGFSYTCAEGKVNALTESSYSVDIPLKYEKKVYDERKYREKYLIFFNNEIKIYSNNRNSYTSCDIIDTVEYANPFSLGELPFGIRTVRYLSYTYEPAERSAEEAIDLAFFKLRCAEEEMGISDVISKQLSGEFTDGVYRLHSTTTSVKNIAKQVEVILQP